MAMNPDTGEIKQFTVNEIQMINSDRERKGCKKMVPVKRKPDMNCKRCNGRGSVLVGKKRKRYRPCKCVV